jgi:hypothetical protein
VAVAVKEIEILGNKFVDNSTYISSLKRGTGIRGNEFMVKAKLPIRKRRRQIGFLGWRLGIS